MCLKNILLALLFVMLRPACMMSANPVTECSQDTVCAEQLFKAMEAKKDSFIGKPLGEVYDYIENRGMKIPNILLNGTGIWSNNGVSILEGVIILDEILEDLEPAEEYNVLYVFISDHVEQRPFENSFDWDTIPEYLVKVKARSNHFIVKDLLYRKGHNVSKTSHKYQGNNDL